MEVKDIKGYEGYYAVTSTGDVISLRRYTNHPKGGQQVIKSKVLKPNMTTPGYYKVDLSKPGQKKEPKQIHRLVAEHFIDNPRALNEVNHIDCDKTNNNIENLEWVTRRENHTHAVANGRRDTTMDVQTVRKLKDQLKIKSLKELSDETGVKHSTLQKIKYGKSWEWLD